MSRQSKARPRLSSNLRAFLDQPRKLLIDGEFVSAQSGRLLDCVDPSSGTPIGEAHAAGTEDIDRAVASAVGAFKALSWRRMRPTERAACLHRLADLVRQNGDDFVHLEALNQGHPIANLQAGLIKGLCDTLRYYAGWCTKLEGSTLATSLEDSRGPDAFGPAYHAYTMPEPIGVVAAIAPWNYPLAMAVGKIAPALAAGCTVVFKPAEETPLTASLLGQLISQAGIPDGVVNIVSGTGLEAGSALAAHPDIDKISFTGSTATGREIVRLAAGNLKRVTLELGGKSPVIVLADADLDAAADSIAAGIFGNAGQVCTAGSRLLIERKVFRQLLDKLIERARALRIGEACDPDTQLGPLVSARQKQRVLGYLSGAAADGCEIVTGGHAIDRPGFFVEPTICITERSDSRFVREEIFGPALVATPVEGSLAGIAALANDSDYGLAASVWTRDLRSAHALTAELNAGVVWTNGHNLFDEAHPFGGFGQSGWGKEGGLCGLHEYLRSKTAVMRL